MEKQTTRTLIGRTLLVLVLATVVSGASAVVGVPPVWAAAGDPILLDTAASFQTSTGHATGGLFAINLQSGAQIPLSPTATSSGTNYLNGNNPRGVAVGSDGYILVAQQNGFARNRGGVIGIDPSTGEQRVVSSERSLVNPYGIAIDPSEDPANPVGSAGNVIVSDTGANAVVRVNPVTNVQALVAPAGSPLVAVRGIAVAEDGTIFVADHGRPGVEMLVPGAPAFAVMVEKSPFESPEGVAVALDQQSIYVVDPNANAVFQVQRSTWTVSTVYKGSPFNHPLGIATDTDGTLLIADQGAKAVWRLNPQVTPVPTPTLVSADGSFESLFAVAVGEANPLTPTGQTTWTQVPRSSAAFPPLCSTVNYTVPAGVTKVHYQLVGESGAHGPADPGDGGDGGDGGFAAMLTGELAVTPGQTLYINLGNNNSHGAGHAVGGDMSYIAAAPGLTGEDVCPDASPPQTDYLAIAAGGGGGGQGGAADGGNGGDAALQGFIGEDCSSCSSPGHGGFPGTQTAGGAAGGAGATGGSYLQGGTGGEGSDGGSFSGTGGGGGGGLYGGGGASGGNNGAGGAGGGGGASYVNPATASGPTTVSWSRSRLQAPTVIITPVTASLGNGNDDGHCHGDPQPGHGNAHRPKPPY